MTISAADILAAHDPSVVLGPDPVRGFRRLAQAWHPDHNADPQARAVMAHLVKLRDAARAGVRLADPSAEVIAVPGGSLRFESAEIHMDAPGGGAAARVLSDLRVASADLSRRLPGVLRDDATSLTLHRPKDSYPMVAVLRAFPSGVPQEHVAWMVSRLYEVVAETAIHGRKMIGGLLPESLLVLRESHGVIPLDWRFAAPLGSRLTQIPGALAGFVGPDKTADTRIDLMAVNRIAIVLLGDPSGIGNVLLPKARAGSIRPAFLDWFRAPPSDDLAAYYRSYRAMLETTFGPPKYHNLNLG